MRRFREITTTARPGHVGTALVMAGIGLWISERMSSDQARYMTALAPWLTAVMVVGGTASAVVVYLSGVPTRIAEGNSRFWEGWGLPRILIEAAFSGTAALIWSGVLMVLFRPG